MRLKRVGNSYNENDFKHFHLLWQIAVLIYFAKFQEKIYDVPFFKTADWIQFNENWLGPTLFGHFAKECFQCLMFASFPNNLFCRIYISPW